MNVTFGRFFAHGTGGNFNRWFEESQFRFQQCVSHLGGDHYDLLHIDLMMPGPQGDFGEPSISCRLQPSERQIRAELVLDPATYGAASNAKQRIQILFDGLADIACQLCIELDELDIADKIWAQVNVLKYEVLAER